MTDPHRTLRRPGWALLLGLTAAVAGCTSPSSPGSAPEDGDQRPPAVASAVARDPAAPAVTDCGRERVDLDHPRAGAGRDCFVRALAARRAATLVSVTRTTEGDPITYTLAASAQGTIMVTVDADRDQFRGDGPARTRYSCQSMDSRPETRRGVADAVAGHLHGCTPPGPAGPWHRGARSHSAAAGLPPVEHDQHCLADGRQHR